VLVQGAITNLEVLWEIPEYRSYCEQLASFSRLIIFDKRGMGLSDRVRIGTLEERMDDVRAIMEDVGTTSACPSCSVAFRCNPRAPMMRSRSYAWPSRSTCDTSSRRSPHPR
jgi:hypothetical protein